MFGQQVNKNSVYAEGFVPTFWLASMICEGESVRILRTFQGLWRIYLRTFDSDDGSVDWRLVGRQAFVDHKPGDWGARPENQRDGGKLFDNGNPTYKHVVNMLQSSQEHAPKNPAERAATAFDFIKGSL
jgi:hypothetical protein